MKRVILDIGYRYYLAPEDVDIGSVLNVFSDFVEVEKKYYDGQDYFHPKDQQQEVEIRMVSAQNIRDLTPEEKENKKIKDLEGSLSYQKDQVQEKDKEIQNLKCQLELLKREDNQQEVSKRE